MLVELDHGGGDRFEVRISVLAELRVYTDQARKCDHLCIAADGSYMLHIQGSPVRRMDIHTVLFLCCGSNRFELDDDGILDLWLQLWGLPCGQYHGLVLLPAVHVQLADLDSSLGRLAQHCGLVVRLPEGVEFLQ